MSDVIVIGVAGGTGSGKTTLVKALVNRFGDNISVLSHDNYYKRHDEMSYEERTHLNYDCPDAFDTDMMIDHLRMLKNGQAIDCPTYDYTIHNRAEEVLHIEPRRVIVVEGIMIFVNKTLCDEMNIRIFVDADADVRLCRRIRRDVKKRGRSIDSVIDQYLTTVKPMHELYVEPSKKNAHIIVPEGGKNLIALEMIITASSVTSTPLRTDPAKQTAPAFRMESRGFLCFRYRRRRSACACFPPRGPRWRGRPCNSRV